ncbi:Hypothetical predicted protein [Octopus vulgaris]|uniref:Uncharacterized protein n=3 Tax=Octopus TaxID=6643 RepID=A0AA36AGC1_OCTVU|nr:Hypothetical predicted protein [Octopus vulgaris]
MHDPSLSSDRIVLYSLNCSTKPRHINLACLASFDINAQTKAVVLKAVHRKHNFVCWVFTSRNKILVLPPSDCTNTTAHEQPIIGGREDEASEFSIMKDVSRTCEELCLTSTPSYLTANTTLLPSSSYWDNSSGVYRPQAETSANSKGTLPECNRKNTYVITVMSVLFFLIPLVCVPA